MSEPASIDDRIEAAVAKAEGGAQIYHDVANGAAGDYVSTESGPLPTIAEWLALNEEALGGVPALAAEVDALQLTVAALSDEVDLLKSSEVVLPSKFGIQTLEQGFNNPAVTTAQWETMRVYVELNQANVYIPPGTYILDPNTRMDADNSRWVFAPGAILKLRDAQTTNVNFLVFAEPNNQRVYGLTFDANKANQVSATFGIDRCGCIIISPDNFKIIDTNIISSPAKGLALVSAAGQTSKDFTIDGVAGGNCVYQAVLIDGNNMTGFFLRGQVSRVKIGDTLHGGLVVNDGVHNTQFSDNDCDVNNSTWDAISVRDCWDLQFSNTKGRRARNGMQIFSLNTRCRDIDIGDFFGELSTSGLLITSCDNITGGNVTCRNNSFAGINIAQTGGGVRSTNILINNPHCYDNRGGGATQLYGLHVAGCDGGTFGRGRHHGNLTRNVRINRSVSTDISAGVEQRKQVAIGSVPASSSLILTVTFDLAFEDADYDISMYISYASNAISLDIGQVSGQTASGFTVLIRNYNAAAISTGTLNVVATRRP